MTTDEDNDSDNYDKCHNMYMTMYMDGFHYFRSSSSCLNYFVSTWKVQTTFQFYGCILYTFLLAILLEAVSFIRTICIQSYSTKYCTRQQYQQQNYTSIVNNNKGSAISLISGINFMITSKYTYHVVLLITYGLQLLIGYLLMLVTMSYAIELLISVVVGLIIGNMLFARYETENGDDNVYDHNYIHNYNIGSTDNNNNNNVINVNDEGRDEYNYDAYVTRTSNSSMSNDETESLLAEGGGVRRRG